MNISPGIPHFLCPNDGLVPGIREQPLHSTYFQILCLVIIMAYILNCWIWAVNSLVQKAKNEIPTKKFLGKFLEILGSCFHWNVWMYMEKVTGNKTQILRFSFQFTYIISCIVQIQTTLDLLPYNISLYIATFFVASFCCVFRHDRTIITHACQVQLLHCSCILVLKCTGWN
jgi:hypothetical protein